jgi:hypothetical protein
MFPVNSAATLNQVKKFALSQLLIVNSAVRCQMVVKNAVLSRAVTQFVLVAQVAKFVNRARAVANATKNQASAFVLVVLTVKSAVQFQVKISAAQFLTKIKSAVRFPFLTATRSQRRTFASKFLTKSTSAVTSLVTVRKLTPVKSRFKFRTR